MWLLRRDCCILEELFYSLLDLTAMLAQHEYPAIKKHVTLMFHKLWKPKSDCIQLWVVGDILKAFQFQSHDQNEMFSLQTVHILEFNYKTLLFSLLGWQLHLKE